MEFYYNRYDFKNIYEAITKFINTEDYHIEKMSVGEEFRLKVMIETLLNKSKNDDKVIYNMAKYINTFDIDEDHCKNYSQKECDDDCILCITNRFRNGYRGDLYKERGLD